MLLVLALLALAFWAWVVFEPTWLPRPPQNRVTTVISERTDEAQVVSTRWWDRLAFWQRPAKLARQFKTWAGEAAIAKRTPLYKGLPDDAGNFVAWLESLPDNELAMYVRDVTAFCKFLNFDLGWLMDPKTDSELKRALEETVILYSLATWKARDVAALSAYQAWLSAPDRYDNRVFAQHLYTNLVNAGLAPATPELLLASDKQRYTHVVQSIEKAAGEHYDDFIIIVKRTATELVEDKKRAKQATRSADAPKSAVEVSA